MSISRVQSKSTSNGGGVSANAVLTPTSSITSGSLLVVGACLGAGVTVSSVTDTLNGSWSQQLQSTVGGFQTSIWAFPNSAAGSATITVSFSGGATCGVAVVEYSGMPPTISLAGNGTSSDVAQTSHATGSVATSQTALLLGVFGAQNGPTGTAGAGWTGITNPGITTTLYMEDQGVGSAGKTAGSYDGQYSTDIATNSVNLFLAIQSVAPVASTPVPGTERGGHRLAPPPPPRRGRHFSPVPPTPARGIGMAFTYSQRRQAGFQPRTRRGRQFLPLNAQKLGTGLSLNTVQRRPTSPAARGLRRGRVFQTLTQGLPAGAILLTNHSDIGVSGSLAYVTIRIRPIGVHKSTGEPFYPGVEIIHPDLAGNWAAFVRPNTQFSDTSMFYLITEFYYDGTVKSFKARIPDSVTTTVALKDVLI